MKMYKEALAELQKMVDEQHANELERKRIINLILDADDMDAEHEKYKKDIGYLQWRNQVLEGNIRGALYIIDFIYREDGNEVDDDLMLYPSVD